MSRFWVIDTKCKVLPHSELPQDGSTYYFGRSVVPANSKEIAIEKLIQILKDNHILVETILAAVLYEDGHWDDEDDFEVHASFEESNATNEIEIGCFISEKSIQGS